MKKSSAILWAFIMLLAIMAVSCSKGKNPTAPPEKETYTVTGIIREGDSGLAGVSVRITGNSVDQTAITDSNGTYAFSDISDGTYAITPSKSGYTFNPASATVTISGSDKTAGIIIATKAGYGYTVTGIIREGDSGLAGVSVRITSSSVDQTTITDSNGAYAFSNLANGTYTITPSKAGYSFTPSSAQVTVNGANTSTANISATQQGGTHTIPNITFVSIPGGTFQMGGNYSSNQEPIHTVTVSSFEMSAYEITNTQYAAYLNAAIAVGDIKTPYDTNLGARVEGVRGEYAEREFISLPPPWGFYNVWDSPISYKGGLFIVESGYEKKPALPTFIGAKAFVLYYGLDLSTEAEWEYACRGGRQYEYGTDDGTISPSKANYGESDKGKTDVGNYPANPFGLYDMSGNVWEFCSDSYNNYTSGSFVDPHSPSFSLDTTRVMRGGSYFDSKEDCQSSARAWIQPYISREWLGFRVVRRPGGKSY